MEAKPTVFEFSSYNFEPEKKRVSFGYKQEFSGKEPLVFSETIILPETVDLKNIPEELVKKLLQGLHLMLGISYYKFYCATKIKLPYSLSKEEADFWNTIYKDGLGEFWFKNKLDPKKSPKFPYNNNLKSETFSLKKNNECLVALSGGKDSIVAAELLKEQGIDVATIFTETNIKSDLVDNVAEKFGGKFLKIQRFLDWQVFQKHKYDGHIPISAIYAFLGIFYAVLYNYSYFVVANEYSSNFGNIKYKGKLINHQWSKSSEFENLFSDYLNNFVSPDVKYFSLLRPFYEIRIAEQFSKYKKYFPYFSSCNKNFKLVKEDKKGLWCGCCPKCVFVFNLLSAFLIKEELLDIFKKNLYRDESLLPLFKDVLGLGTMKPFDCVGTFEESKASFAMSVPKFKNDFIVKTLLPKIKKPRTKDLFKTHPSPNIPAQFKFSGMKNVLILGFGREGEASKKYVEKKYPNLKIGVADKKDGKNYLKKQKDYDFLIKTPGINKNLIKIPYTTATNIFFSNVKELGNKIIGVTGSKGKSTTASLIYSILKEGGKNARLLGNIGSPMLGAMTTPIQKDEIFVIELSSYQLDDIKFSPDIAVVTNLFPEHMDYHKGEKNYYDAKKNIINFQNENNTFVYNKNIKKLEEWKEETKAKKIPIANKKFLDGVNLPLIGEHNKENILIAVAVAKELLVSDRVIKTAIENFKPLPHRLEFIGEFKNIKFYDDAISTTPESTIMAIKALKNVDTIFLGGEDRGYNFSQLEKTIKKYRIRNVALFPNSGTKIKTKGLNALKTKSMEAAVKFAYKYTAPGKICLLSCASPSYSVWKNFEEKGNQFKNFVKEQSK
ncbi:MAG: UDP-N-acetylmuramoyl-L-alanine--D-glutamate ligase [Candidatus Staskawiczbacteria bacterium]|nr:UDP-N-acetylmuramoyl-L-alanine--D-glutamate ligase [Candidatus Staskawiczbacteria bacterium]